MTKRLMAGVGLLILLALTTSQKASACELCWRAGYVCNGNDDCAVIFRCQERHIGGGGFNDCSEDSSGCHTDGGACQWASRISPMPSPIMEALFTPICHETDS